MLETSEFINLVAGPAQRSYLDHHIFASVTIAQAILESGWGKYIPVDPATQRSSYNLFGIKGVGPAGSVRIASQEVENGQTITRVSEFKAYFNFQQSIDDHAQFLLQPKYKQVITASDPFAAAHALETAGYATDPSYAEKLSNLVRTHNLTRFDLVEPAVPAVPPWKLDIGKRALNEGLLTDPEWLTKLDEPMPTWAVLTVALRVLDKARGIP